MNRTESEDRAIDALLTRELLTRVSETDISAADVKAFLADKTPLSIEDSETLRRLAPLGPIAGKGGTTNVLRFPDLGEAGEMRLRAAARQQETKITDPEALKALAEKRKEAVERARRRRLQTDKSQE